MATQSNSKRTGTKLGVLYEMAYIGAINSRLEAFVNTNDRGDIPHFHIGDIDTMGEAFQTSVRFDSPQYFNHIGNEGVLEPKEKASLCEFMRSPSRNNRYSSNWEYALSMWNDNNPLKPIDEDSEMPDYRLLS